MKLTGWGRYPRFEARMFRPTTLREAARLQQELDGSIARGNGRAYGDAAIGEVNCICASGLDRFLRFDQGEGRLTVEAGAMLSDIIAAFLPRGFFPPIVPGTKFVTVGGMIAADVHGKNHHGAGGFGDHVEAFELALPSGEVRTCSRDQNARSLHRDDWRHGAYGNHSQRHVQALGGRDPLDEAGDPGRATISRNPWSILTERDDAPYSAAWIDCLATGASLGRSLIYLGRHASKSDVETIGGGRGEPAIKPGRSLSVPVDLPGFTLNRWSVRAFNELYFRRGAGAAGAPFLNRIEPFFFPLDSVLNWNRIYGRRGFLQHQSVIEVRPRRIGDRRYVEPFRATRQRIVSRGPQEAWPCRSRSVVVPKSWLHLGSRCRHG